VSDGILGFERMSNLSQLFIEHVPESCRDDIAAVTDLEQRLTNMIAQARESWPDLQVEAEAFFQYVASRLSPDIPATENLERLRGDDVYLACACAAKDEAGLREFRALFDRKIRSALGRIMPSEFVDGIAQELIAKLLVSGPAGKPAICSYAGRGKLSTWVKVITVRDGSRLFKKKRRDKGKELDALVDLAIETDDPELKHLKKKYRDEFKSAFQRAFDKLSARQRNLLRYECIDGLNIDRIGVLYGVHRSTVARWRVAARTTLFKETRRFFTEELKISGTEFDSVMRLIQSQLDVSLHRLLQSDD